MDIKMLRIVTVFLLFLVQGTILAAEIILTEQEKKWDHPVLSVFNKYGISLYKVSYSRDGRCPTFYATFKYPITSQGTNTPNFQKVYAEILKTNSYCPYALMDKKNIKMQIDIDKAASTSLCKDGKNHADDDADIEPFIISKQMKKRIMNSPFKTPLRRADGKNFVAYLYAENEKSTPEEHTSCINYKDYQSVTKTGLYHIYLYDIDSHSFLQDRITIFKNFKVLRMNIEGAVFFTWSNIDKNQSDVLLVSQFVSCSGDQYEAYGFIDNSTDLKRYRFFGKEQYDSFYGRVDQDVENNKGNLIAYKKHDNHTDQFELSISKKPGIITYLKK